MDAGRAATLPCGRVCCQACCAACAIAGHTTAWGEGAGRRVQRRGVYSLAFSAGSDKGASVTLAVAAQRAYQQGQPLCPRRDLAHTEGRCLDLAAGGGGGRPLLARTRGARGEGGVLTPKFLLKIF